MCSDTSDRYPASSHIAEPNASAKPDLAAVVLGSLGALVMAAIGLIVGLQFQSQRFEGFSPWRMLKFLASITTGWQGVEIVAWALLTGGLIAIGVRAVPVTRSRAGSVLAAGAFVPIGLVVLAHALNRIWPDTTVPPEAPVMTLLLALYSLAIPWLLGRLIARWLPAYGVAADKQITMSQ